MQLVYFLRFSFKQELHTLTSVVVIVGHTVDYLAAVQRAAEDTSAGGEHDTRVIETLQDVHLLQVTVAAAGTTLPPTTPGHVSARDVLQYQQADYMNTLHPLQPPTPQVRAAPGTMNQLGTVYATKRRRRNGKSLKPPPKDGVAKSNPSKRHRERLNAELDNLASLLPFEQNILSKLDRLSILRLSVSYLRTKSYFHVVMHRDKEDLHDATAFRSRDFTALDHSVLDGDMFLQHTAWSGITPQILQRSSTKALNGFLLILTCEGEVFFATHTIESYLGFHQSDIVHQSVYELVHSEDREELQRQLLWNSFLPSELSGCSLSEALLPENTPFLERSFTVRFRCLLDNTSGFLRLDIRGRVKVLHGQNRRTEEPPLALFAVCTPFGPPSLLEVPQKEVMFKSKHKLDLAHVSMDQRGKLLLGYTDAELANMGGYHLVHYDDLAYVASAHQELLKTGASGMIAYRYQTKDGSWQWLQTSSRLVYKNSKPDFVISTHRPLMEEEGRDLLGKRTMDFKVSYLDAGLTNSYFSDTELQSNNSVSAQISPSASPATNNTTTAPRVNRRYKTQLRDFLSTCRTKRKLQPNSNNNNNTNSSVNAVASQPQQQPASVSTQSATPEYHMELSSGSSPLQQQPVISPASSSGSSSAAVAAAAAAASAAAAAAYSNMYMTTGPTEYIHQAPPQAFHPQQLYTHQDNRFLTDNIFHQYRALPPYYPDYHHAAVAAVTAPPYNGYIDVQTSPTRNTYEITKSPSCTSEQDRLYSCQIDRNYLVFPTKSEYHDLNNGLDKKIKTSPNGSPNSHHQQIHHHHHSENGIKMEVEDKTSPYNNDTRQTVLMWGTTNAPTNNSRPPSQTSSSSLPLTTYQHIQDEHNDIKNKSPPHSQYTLQTGDPLKSLAEMNSDTSTSKWTGYNKLHQRLSSPQQNLYQQQTAASVESGQQLNNLSTSSGGTSSTNTESQQQNNHKQQSERSPLLSISEVTNTLLDHQ